MTPEDREDIKRHLNVVAEGLRSDNQMLAKAISMNTDWLGRLERRLQGHDGRLEGHGMRLDRVESELHALRDEMRQGNERLGRLESEMRRGFSELGSMVKLTYGQLDARLTPVETAR